MARFSISGVNRPWKYATGTNTSGAATKLWSRYGPTCGDQISELTLSLPRDQLQIFPQPPQKSCITQSEELGSVHRLLRWKMIILLPILTTALIHLSLNGWENVLFVLASERNKIMTSWRGRLQFAQGDDFVQINNTLISESSIHWRIITGSFGTPVNSPNKLVQGPYTSFIGQRRACSRAKCFPMPLSFKYIDTLNRW